LTEVIVKQFYHNCEGKLRLNLSNHPPPVSQDLEYWRNAKVPLQHPYPWKNASEPSMQTRSFTILPKCREADVS
jgi:hypothetical protein